MKVTQVTWSCTAIHLFGMHLLYVHVCTGHEQKVERGAVIQSPLYLHVSFNL